LNAITLLAIGTYLKIRKYSSGMITKRYSCQCRRSAFRHREDRAVEVDRPAGDVVGGAGAGRAAATFRMCLLAASEMADP
jgi:hypothetical protein